MVGLSEADGFTAAELAARGFGVDRIAVLLSVDVKAVERCLRGDLGAVVDEVAPDAARVDDDDAVEEAPAAVPVVAGWPPAVSSSTRWREIRLPGASVPGASVQDGGVRVRRVLLWGQAVWINEAGAVFCPGCGAFRSTGELSGPWSTCSVGLRRGAMGGVRAFDGESEPDEPRYLPVSGRLEVDFTRVQW